MAQGIDIVIPQPIPGLDKVRLPSDLQMKGWFYPRNNAEEAVNNFVPGGPDARLVGTPTFTDAGFMDVTTNQHYIEYNLFDDTEEFTTIVAFRNDDTLADAAHQPILMSSYDGLSGSLLWISENSSEPLPFATARCTVYTNAGNNASLSIADIGDLTVLALRSTAGAAALRNLGAGGGVATPTLTAARTPSGRMWRTGWYHSAAFAGKTKLAFAGISTKSLSDLELSSALAIALADLAYEGVTP